MFEFLRVALFFIGSLIVSLALRWLIKKSFLSILKTSSYDSYLPLRLLSQLQIWFLTPWFFWIFCILLEVSLSRSFWSHILLAVTVAQIVYWAFQALSWWQNRTIEKIKSEDPGRVAGINLLILVIRASLVTVALLLVLDNWGYDIKSLVAGLGVGGIAVALAAQNIVGDLLASFSILFDKPFSVGDFITLDQERGTVEHIGIKTTRIRATTGEELIIPNRQLLEGRIHNFKRMQKRRVSHSISVVYSTPSGVLKEIPELLKKIINKRADQAEFLWSGMTEFGDSGLIFECHYFVLTADFFQAVRIRHEIMNEIIDMFRSLKIEFAFPARTLFIEKNSSNVL